MSYNILVIDDSACMRKVLKKSIVMCGIGDISFYEAGNGLEGLEVIKKEWIDIIFTDIHMPIMNGLELVKALRADEAIKHTPIIVVTSDTNAENSAEVKAYDIKDIIYKPFRAEDIRRLLTELLGLEETYNEENPDTEGLDF